MRDVFAVGAGHGSLSLGAICYLPPACLPGSAAARAAIGRSWLTLIADSRQLRWSCGREGGRA